MKPLTLKFVDKRVAEYIKNNSTSLPRFVLMDTKIFINFSKSMFPIERSQQNELLVKAGNPSPRLTGLVLNSLPSGISVLEVVSKKYIFEVVG